MMVSAELRWFWKDAAPPDITHWFDRGVPAGGGEPRRDRYYPQPGPPELGVKTRGEGGGKEQVEIKGLVGTRTPQILDPRPGLDLRRVEIWCKWSASVKPEGPGLLVEKRRRLRKFADGVEEIPLDVDEQPVDRREPLPAGCIIELTKINLPEQNDTWWTLGFEAFGGLDEV